MSEDWDRARYERERRNFIESRLLWRWVYFHTATIFAVTWLAGWLCSFLLLRSGLGNMPARYAISFLISYLVFMACVRVWADFMREERGHGGDGAIDMPVVDAEGCAFTLAALLLGLIAAGLFSALGGLPLLLEVAFEVVFAGVVVRRISRKHRVGHWATTLLRNTWMHALAALLILVGVAGWLQTQAPGSQTFAQAARILMAR